jgi:two-component system, NarL family, nitrate/nitrite response regulator NarL
MTHSATVKVVPTVALIYEEGLFAEGLASILEKTPFRIAFQTTTLEAASLESFRPEGKLVVLVGGQSVSQTLTTVRSLRSMLTTAYVLVLGATTETHDIGLVLEAGADGFLRETVTSETLMMAIELAARDEAVLPAEFIKTLTRSNGSKGYENPGPELACPGRCCETEQERVDGERNGSAPALSHKEEATLQLLAKGATNKLIAQKLNITEATVKVHVKAILRKIRAKNRTQAAIWAFKYYAAQGSGLYQRQITNGHA